MVLEEGYLNHMFRSKDSAAYHTLVLLLTSDSIHPSVQDANEALFPHSKPHGKREIC